MHFWRNLFVLAVLRGTSAKKYNPCEVASEILKARVPIPGDKTGKLEPLQCSKSDIARLVCVASLHNFDTNFHVNEGNETYVGIFGIPLKKSHNTSSIFVSQQNFVDYQLMLRLRKMTAVSEVICNYFYWFMDNYVALAKYWNTTVNATQMEQIWNKRMVVCQDFDLNVFVVDEKFSKNYYKPGAFVDFPIKNVSQRNEDLFEKPCHGDFYCGGSKCLGDFTREDKGKGERKVERLVKVVDWTVIVMWCVVVVGGISGGYWYMRQPKRRGTNNDDWGRPILTAHYNS